MNSKISSGSKNNFLNFLGDVLSFSSTYRAYSFILIVLFLFFVPVSFLEDVLPNLSICSYVLGKYCYSFGITRGVASLLKGNFSLAWDYNPLSFLVLVLFSLIPQRSCLGDKA